MSVSSVPSSIWTQPTPPSVIGGASSIPPQGTDTAAGQATPATASSGTATPAPGSASLFQTLASDLQAMLVQLQGGASGQIEFA